MTKEEAILDAIRKTDIGSDVVIHNEDMSIFCVLRVIKKFEEASRQNFTFVCECGNLYVATKEGKCVNCIDKGANQ